MSSDLQSLNGIDIPESAQHSGSLHPAVPEDSRLPECGPACCEALSISEATSFGDQSVNQQTSIDPEIVLQEVTKVQSLISAAEPAVEGKTICEFELPVAAPHVESRPGVEQKPILASIPTVQTSVDPLLKTVGAEDQVPENIFTEEQVLKTVGTEEQVPETAITEQQVSETVDTEEQAFNTVSTEEQIPKTVVTEEQVPEIVAEQVSGSVVTEDLVPEPTVPEEQVPDTVVTEKQVPEPTVSATQVSDTPELGTDIAPTSEPIACLTEAIESVSEQSVEAVTDADTPPLDTTVLLADFSENPSFCAVSSSADPPPSLLDSTLSCFPDTSGQQEPRAPAETVPASEQLVNLDATVLETESGNLYFYILLRDR